MTGTEQRNPRTWYAAFLTELRTRGITEQEADQIAQATRAEAEAAGSAPSNLYGPAVLYARGIVERTERFGYAPQLGCLAPLLTVDEHLRLFGAVRGMTPGRATATGHRLLSRLGWRARGAQSAGRLSGGTQQKLNLCLAQLDSPDLLLLDEPYQGFDALAYEELWDLIRAWRSTGAGILLVTHLLRDVDLVDRVVELPPPLEALR